MTLLAHAGSGSTWQAMVVAFVLALVVVVALAVAGRLELERPGDLVLPFAGAAVLSSLSPLVDRWVSDWIGWALPVGAVILVTLLLVVLTPLELSPEGWLPYAAVGLAVVGAVALYRPLTIELHPPPDLLPERGEAEVAIAAPEDGATLEAGETLVEVEVTGGSIGPGGVPFEDLPSDGEQAGTLTASVAGENVPVEPEQDCALDDPCSRVTFPVEMPEGESVRLRVELLRGDGMPFAPSNDASVTVTVE